MQFKKLTSDLNEIYTNYLAKNDYLNSISDFNFFYLWNINDVIGICFEDNLAILKGVFSGKTFFYSPSLQDIQDFDKCLNLILQYQDGKPFYFAGIGEHIFKQIDTLPNGVKIYYDRNSSDYVYNTTDLCELKGKKFHAKRNFVNFFKNNYNYKFVEYQDTDYQSIMDIFDEWQKNSDHKVDPNEKIAINRALLNYKQLGLKIGLLTIDDKIEAFSISSISANNLGQVFFEKANTQFKGIYAMINYLTANNFLAETQFINREEDMGIEGLRKAKLSLNPALIYNKYIVEYGNTNE